MSKSTYKCPTMIETIRMNLQVLERAAASGDTGTAQKCVDTAEGLFIHLRGALAAKGVDIAPSKTDWTDPGPRPVATPEMPDLFSGGGGGGGGGVGVQAAVASVSYPRHIDVTDDAVPSDDIAAVIRREMAEMDDRNARAIGALREDVRSLWRPVQDGAQVLRAGVYPRTATPPPTPMPQDPQASRAQWDVLLQGWSVKLWFRLAWALVCCTGVLFGRMCRRAWRTVVR